MLIGSGIVRRTHSREYNADFISRFLINLVRFSQIPDLSQHRLGGHMGPEADPEAESFGTRGYR